MTAHTPDGGGLTDAERDALADWWNAPTDDPEFPALIAAVEAILAARAAPDTEAVAAAAWDEALAAVVRGINSAKEAHAEHGHRQIVSALVGLAQAVPRTENPYRRAAGVREGRDT